MPGSPAGTPPAASYRGGMPTADHAPPAAAPICSAKGCSAPAAWALLWNNPALHTPDRRKTWLACGDHRETLGAFLRARNFLRLVQPLDADVDAREEQTPPTG